MPFKMDQKLTIKFWLLLYENLLPRSLKNRPIWSHCCHAMAVFIHAMEHFISGAQLDKLISPLKLQSGIKAKALVLTGWVCKVDLRDSRYLCLYRSYQCDQIWQNFATLANLGKSLDIIWGFILYWAKILTELGIFYEIGQVFIFVNGPISKR